jgi:DMSO/TMAO reductase YedYZ molybdopterin-dependent catalytic subunit
VKSKKLKGQHSMSDQIRFSRREVLRLAVFGALTAFLAACQRAVEPLTGSSQPTPAPTKDSVSKGAPTPAAPSSVADSVPITSNQDFYTVAAGPVPPIPSAWKLTIAGLVDKPLTLTLDEIKALPSVTEMRTLACISNPVGGDLISNAVWKAVRLKDLLALAGVKSNARYLKLEAFDGWSTGIPLELGGDDHALLAYEMNGAPLPRDHGAPLRCLFPGRYGMKQPKWLQTITLVDQEYIGYWEKQGWSNEARIRPFSRIDSPRDLAVINGPTFALSGIAYSDETGLTKLEIGWDDTNQWQPAELTRGPSPYTWTVWRWTGDALPLGRHTLSARATDGRGQTQTRGAVFNLLGGTFPNGTDQMHSIVLEFRG